MNAIEVLGLKKAFGKNIVLDGVSMTVHQGDIYGLLGPNGVGKTTTLRILFGLLTPDKGEISVLGMEPLSSGEEIRRKVNALPESYGFYGWMSAENYLRFFGRLYGKNLTTDDCRIRLHQVGLDPTNHRPTKTFSRGMKQRLGIARALINEPIMLFLDEPTSGLDPRGRREIHNLLLELNREKGMTIIISTHILDDVERLCNRIAILYQGEIHYEGLPAYNSDKQVFRYRFRMSDEHLTPSEWNYQGISLVGKGGNWITCLIEGMSPAEAIKTLVNGGLPIAEAVNISGIENLYLEHTGEASDE